MKIKYNNDLDMLINFIRSSSELISFDELLSYSVSMEIYPTLLINLEILEKLRDEQNEKIMRNIINDNND